MGEPARIARRKPWLAGIMSLSPGFGQLYNGQVTKAVLFFLVALSLDLSIRATLSDVPLEPPLNIAIPALIILALLAIFVADAIIVARRKGEQYELQTCNRWYLYLAFFLLTGLINEGARSVVAIHPFNVAANSMVPTLLKGDSILVDEQRYREGKKPEIGDIIVFKYPEDERKDFLKRVVGTPGDSINIRNKVVYVNGAAVPDQAYTQRVDPGIIDGTINPRDNYGPATVPAHSYFVMGDNRDQSLDSRFWGYVKADQIKGKAMMVYWSWDDKDVNIRWDRIGKKIQ